MERRNKHVQHDFRFRPRLNKKEKIIRCCVVCVCILGLAAGVAGLANYYRQYRESEKGREELRELWHEGDQPTATAAADAGPAEATAAPEITAARAEATPAAVTAPPVRAIATETPALQAALPVVRYPGNEYLLIGERFLRLRNLNSDIVGYLRVGNLLEEAVVQRDNSYYLDRDYQGKLNDNGAIFLDEACDLRTRPYTLMLYGHNMKSGAMFGGLRKYESVSYFRANPFLEFDSLYESGEYVIFAVSQVSLTSGKALFVPFATLYSCTPDERLETLDLLQRRSMINSKVDVRVDDQILLMVTCVGEDDERRIVAARRLREGETREELLRTVSTAVLR